MPISWQQKIGKFYRIMSDWKIAFVSLPLVPSTIMIQSLVPHIDLLLGCMMIKAKQHEQEHKLKTIQKAIEARLINFHDSPAKMTDSLLN